MLSKNDLQFSEENLRKSYLADLQKTYENLTTNLGKVLQKSYKVSKIGPLNCDDWRMRGQKNYQIVQYGFG